MYWLLVRAAFLPPCGPSLFFAGLQPADHADYWGLPELIGQTLLTALARAKFVLVTGGLGSTDDDITTERLAAKEREADFRQSFRYAVVTKSAQLLKEGYQN